MPQTLRAAPSKQVLEEWEKWAWKVHQAGLSAMSLDLGLGGAIGITIISGSNMMRAMAWHDLAVWLHGFTCPEEHGKVEPVPLEKMRRWRTECIDAAKIIREVRAKETPTVEIAESMLVAAREILALGRWLGDVVGE